jgi:hypothetical protein
MSRLILAIESSTDWLSVALMREQECVALRESEPGRRHAATLLPTIDAVLREGGVGLGDLEAIGIATGPGSFTSLRIGLATVKGLGFARAGLEVGDAITGEAARPRADAVGRLARRRLDRGEGGPVERLEARYVRRAQAEAQRLGAPVEAGERARVSAATDGRPARAGERGPDAGA